MRKSVIGWAAFGLVCIAHSASAGGSMVKVLATVNGNTLKVDLRGKEMQLRILGIATPDPNDQKPILKRLGGEAQDFLREMTKSGFVYAEFPNGDPVPDKNGVVNALLWAGKSSDFLNEKIVAEGFGVVDRHESQLTAEMRDQLVKAEDMARMSGRGLWGSFSLGHGADVAAGKTHQGTYLGVAPSGRGRNNDVYVWIVFYN